MSADLPSEIRVCECGVVATGHAAARCGRDRRHNIRGACPSRVVQVVEVTDDLVDDLIEEAELQIVPDSDGGLLHTAARSTFRQILNGRRSATPGRIGDGRPNNFTPNNTKAPSGCSRPRP